MSRARVAVDAAMLTAAVGVDTGVKADVRAVVVSDDRLGTIGEKMRMGGRNLVAAFRGLRYRSMASKRFFGLLAEPRPRMGPGLRMKVYPVVGGAPAAGVAGAAVCAIFLADADLASWAR